MLFRSSLSAPTSPASEQRRRELGLTGTEADSISNAEANAKMLATWLLEKLAQVGSEDKRVECAVEVLAASNLPSGWIPPAATQEILARILESHRDSLIRSRVLTFVGKIDPSQVPEPSRLREVLRKLSAEPDPRLYLALVSLTKRLGMDIAIPKLEVADRDGVLAKMASADVDRGRRMFFDVANGIGCAACHRVAGQGNDFAPDLSSIGLRSKPEIIIESILAPSAAITEG